MRLLAALSGGVDSAVAAARAAEDGHDVTGVHLALTHGVDGSGCCTPADARDAARVADVLDLPFYVWDLADRFSTDVIDDFAAEYAAGRTPNPCLRCNERIKFAAVLDRALALGFDGVVTGHHARLEQTPTGPRLRRSVDLAKDQSYVLGTLRREQLARAVLPLGDVTKRDVRAEAAARGLAVADKPDSTDVCFVGHGGTAAWLRRRLGAAPGPFVDGESGAVLGSHEGAYGFTVGQRRGLGLPGGSSEPRYVLGVEPVTRTVRLGPATALEVEAVAASSSTWDGPARRCLAQLRAHGTPVPALAEPGDEGRLRVLLEVPVRGVAPGQAVVLYGGDAPGDTVLGGAWIDSTSTAEATEAGAVLTVP